MEIDHFRLYVERLHRMTVAFAEAVPDDRWDFSPDPPGKPGREAVRLGLATALRLHADHCADHAGRSAGDEASLSHADRANAKSA